MTVLLAIVLSALHLEDNDLVAFYERIDNLAYYFGTFYGRCTYLYCSFIVDKQYLVELNSLAFLSILDVVDEQFLALLCLELLTVNLYDCVH